MNHMVHIKHDGTVSKFEATNDLATLQSKVGGHVENIRVGRTLRILADEEATLKAGYPQRLNRIASDLFGEYIYGDVILCRELRNGFTGVDEGMFVITDNSVTIKNK